MTYQLVETRYGQVQGERIGNVSVWRGIPYAKPPIGPRRFRAPEPLESWEGILDATQFGPISPQPEQEIMTFLGTQLENMSEDCLYLNVWSPAADGRRRPVMVWIHGGAFISGSGSSPSYNGATFSENGDVVVVTLNYRLGALGFLHLGELAGKDYATSGNNGILDQILALKWVQENIEAFGGDPERVTIFGESAGAMSVATLLATPATKGLFQQAILESGAAANVVSATKATENATKVLQAMTVDPTNLSELETLSVEQIVQASTAVPPMQLVPVIDGIILPKSPQALLEEGAARDIPILIGTNKDEYRLFTCFDPRFQQPTEEALQSLYQQTFGPMWDQFGPLFLGDRSLSVELYDQLMTQVVFNGPATQFAQIQLQHGSPVWMYRFDWESPVLNGVLKSCHALEIPFVWHTIRQPGTDKLVGNASELDDLADQLHQAWIAFAHHGDPNTSGLPEWKPYTLNERATFLFNVESRLVEDPNQAMRLGWENVQSLVKG